MEIRIERVKIINFIKHMFVKYSIFSFLISQIEQCKDGDIKVMLTIFVDICMNIKIWIFDVSLQMA